MGKAFPDQELGSTFRTGNESFPYQMGKEYPGQDCKVISGQTWKGTSRHNWENLFGTKSFDPEMI